MIKPKAIIFDLDGTLLDTLLDIANSMNAVLQRNGYPGRPVQNYRYYVGEGMAQLVRNALHEIPADEATINRLVEEMKVEYAGRWNESSRPYSAIGELILNLSSLPLKLGVLSNKPDEFTKEMVAYYFPDQPFHAIAGAREGAQRKPNPEACLQMIAGWSLQPEEVIFLGDSKTDMQTAVNSGCIPVGALWGFRDREELLEYGAEYLLDTPANLLTLFKG